MPDPRTLAAALREAPGAAALLARCETAARIGRLLQPLVRNVAPGIDLLAPGRCELRDGVLWIAVQSAAESSKLRQAAPRLLAALAADGCQVYEMRTRVQPVATSYPGEGTDEASSFAQAQGARGPGVGAGGLPFPPVTRGSADAVAAAAAPMPASPLRQALQRLARTLQRRSTG
mgnify:CR=1 FL=1